MVGIYVRLVQSGRRTLEQVPLLIRNEVELVLKKS